MASSAYPSELRGGEPSASKTCIRDGTKLYKRTSTRKGSCCVYPSHRVILCKPCLLPLVSVLYANSVLFSNVTHQFSTGTGHRLSKREAVVVSMRILHATPLPLSKSRRKLLTAGGMMASIRLWWEKESCEHIVLLCQRICVVQCNGVAHT